MGTGGLGSASALYPRLPLCGTFTRISHLLDEDETREFGDTSESKHQGVEMRNSPPPTFPALCAQ